MTHLLALEIGGDTTAVGGAIAFIALVAAYAMRLIIRADRKGEAADAFREAELIRTRQEAAFWRSMFLTGEAPADAPPDLKALAPQAHMERTDATDDT